MKPSAGLPGWTCLHVTPNAGPCYRCAPASNVCGRCGKPDDDHPLVLAPGKCEVAA